MVCVQMAFAGCERSAKLLQHFVPRRNTEADLPGPAHDMWLPGAVHTSPAIALEAEHAEPAVIGVITPLAARSATCTGFVFVFITTALTRKRRTARHKARPP